jgi:hypothetical protein
MKARANKESKFSHNLSSFARDFALFAVKTENSDLLKIICLSLSLSVTSPITLCQEDNIPGIIESVAEGLASDEDDPEAAAIFTERLFDLAEKPVRINSADESEISRLFFLTDFQVKSLADHIRSTGRILTKYELASVTGFDRGLAEMISPFISLEPVKSAKKDEATMRCSFVSNFSLKNNRADTTYPGPPWKALSRMNFSAGKLSGGIVAEKDAGEKILSGKPPLPDFFSANLSWSGTGILRKIIIGDFTARFGTGIGLNTGLRTGLSLTQAGYISGNDEIVPYSSTCEYGFFRGIAGRFMAGRTTVSLFFSADKIDAAIDSIPGNSTRFIRTIYRTGLHNTSSSLLSKDAISEYGYGLNVLFDIGNIRTGLLFTGSRLSVPAAINEGDPEEIFDFRGKDNYNASIYYKAVTGKIIVFGEICTDRGMKKAFVQGLSFRPDSRLTINSLYRNYEPGFASFHGKGLLSSSSGNNIKGIFGNFTYEAAKHLFISAGCDLRYYPWLSYRCSSPSAGLSGEVRLRYLPADDLSFEGMFSYRRYPYDNPEAMGVKKQHNMITRSFKVSARYSPAENISIATRLDYKTGGYESSSSGTMIVQDISYRLRSPALAIWLRYGIFTTGSWDARLYAYENDLVYSFSVPAFSGTGERIYLMLDWEIRKSMNLRIKYGITDTYSTSDYQVEAGEVRELRLQLRFKF